MKNKYWHDRLERWGAWRVGAGGVKIATWARLRSDSTLANWAGSDDAVPRTFLEERETHTFIAHLASRPETLDLAAFAVAAYPNTARLAVKLNMGQSSLTERFARLHRTMARLLDQRRRNEALDAERRRPRIRRESVKVDGQRVAAAAVDG